MRERARILDSLETVYRGAFGDAEKHADQQRMGRLDFEFQRDQLFLEVLLDLRDLMESAPTERTDGGSSLIERAKAIKDLTKLR